MSHDGYCVRVMNVVIYDPSASGGSAVVEWYRHHRGRLECRLVVRLPLETETATVNENGVVVVDVRPEVDRILD